MFARPKKLLFVLIVVGLLTCGGGCQETEPIDTGGDSDTDGDTDSDTDTDTGTDSDADSDSDSDSDTGTDDLCGWAGVDELYEVPSPEDGVEPTQAAICAPASPATVESNRAATVALTLYPDDTYVAPGAIALAGDLVGKVIGLPTVEVTGATPAELLPATVSNVAAAGDGFTFDLQLSYSGWVYPGETEITIRVTLEIDCDDASGQTQMVSSITYLHVCNASETEWMWVASGGECAICSEVCEKIACPLPAPRDAGFAALSGAPRAEIVPVAVHGRSVVLFVEHRGTEGPLSYAWKVSGGEVTGQGEAGIIWEAPQGPGPHLVQVAVKDATSATVATLRWRRRA